MPCCILCKHYKFVEGEPRVDKECPGYVADNAMPKWYYTNTSAGCCPKCGYFKKDVKEKKWWCERPFAFEVNPQSSYDAIKLSERAVVKRP